MMKKAHSKQSVAGKIGISRDTLYEWCSKYPEFSGIIKEVR
jgi:transposase-like protein